MKYVLTTLCCAILMSCYSSESKDNTNVGIKLKKIKTNFKRNFELNFFSKSSPAISLKKYDNYTSNNTISSNPVILSYNDWASYRAWDKKLAAMRSENSISYPEILNKSLVAVLGGIKKSKEIKKLLLKYYFTEDENKSIWPKAIRETELHLNLKFSRDELFNMEKDVKAVYRRMLECDFLFSPFIRQKKPSKKKNHERRKLKTKCYLTLHEYINSGFTDFEFPRGSVEGEAKMLQMALAYHMMSLLVLQMTQQMAIIAHVTPIKAAISIIDIADNLVESIKSFTKNTIDGRIQAISQIEICQMEVLFWKEFPVTCEIRIKRDINSVDGIGGNKDFLIKRYRAKVIDNVTDKEVCNMALDTSETKDKDQVIFELTKACGLIRDNYARRIKKDITDFYTQRTLPVVKELSKLWYNDKKKLAEIKDKLQNKYQSSNQTK